MPSRRPVVRGLVALALHLVAAVAGSVTALADEPSLIEPGAKVERVVAGMGMKFLEGPAWLEREKKVVFSDIPNGKIMQWSADGGLSVYRETEQSNGNELDMEGRLVSCQGGGRNIVRAEADGTIKVLVDRFEGKRFNQPNDLAVRSDGTIYFTDPAYGAVKDRELPGCWVYRLDPQTGDIKAILKDLALPNGIVFSPDETRIYISDYYGKNVIRCYDVAADGTLGEKRWEIPQGSDGMTVDEQGNLYTTGPGVMVFSPDGKKLEQIMGGGTNVCFGGDDYRTLFITGGNALHSVRMKIPGHRPKKKAG